MRRLSCSGSASSVVRTTASLATARSSASNATWRNMDCDVYHPPVTAQRQRRMSLRETPWA